jgi:hypothetical protein
MNRPEMHDTQKILWTWKSTPWQTPRETNQQGAIFSHDPTDTKCYEEVEEDAKYKGNYSKQ